MKRFLAGVVTEASPRLISDAAPVAFGERQVLYRGYVAERAALLAEVRGCIPGLAADSDAALFALAYERWGADLARHVAGEYAVAIWDEGRGRLLLAHDELGLMPLFYTLEHDAIAFASHLDDLVLETGAGELDEEYVADHLARGDHFGERTPYAHIRRLLPGESVLWKDGVRTRRDVWTLDAVEPLRLRDERDYEERLRRLVVEAVDAALPPSRRVWCELSGGLDSSTVFSVARQMLGVDAEALSFVFPESATADERPWIRAVLRRHPATWHAIDADSAQPFTEISDAFHGEPTRWIANAGWNRLYAALVAEHGVEVVLTGEGGDAVLFGDEQSPCHLADHLLRGRWRSLWTEARRWSEGSRDKRSATHQLVNFALVPALRSLRAQALEFRAVPIPWVSEAFARRYGMADRGRAPWLPRARSVGDAYMLQRVMRSANVVATMFAPRHLSADVRSPLLARSIVAYMLAVPWEQRMHPNATRVLQRRALRGILPDVTLARWDKGGSDQPSCDGLRNSEVVVAALTGRPRIVERGYVRLDAWKEAIDQARFGRMVGLKYFEASATLELWLQSLERISRDGNRRLRGEAAATYRRLA